MPTEGCNNCHMSCGANNDYVCSPNLQLASLMRARLLLLALAACHGTAHVRRRPRHHARRARRAAENRNHGDP